MNRNMKVFSAIASLALAALACQAAAGAPTSNAPTDSAPGVPEDTAVPLPTEPEPPADNSEILFEDDFSAGMNVWGTGTDADSAVEYVDETLNFQIFTNNYSVRTSANDKDYENVHMEVTVINNQTDATAAFGLICYMQFIDDSHYYFAVTPAGEYAIGKASLALDDVLLTNNGEWADSDLIAKNAASYRVGADCGGGKLTLYVDGQEIASSNDTTYTTGGFAVFAWSGPDSTLTDVSFDDFVMTKLP